MADDAAGGCGCALVGCLIQVVLILACCVAIKYLWGLLWQ